jgi:hypothetical protein
MDNFLIELKHMKKTKFFISLLFISFFFFAPKVYARGNNFQIYMKDFLIGFDNNGFKYCDYEFGVKNLSDKTIDKLKFQLSWRRRSLKRGYVVGNQKYKVLYDKENIKPNEMKSEIKLSVRKWCDTIKAHGPNIEIYNCEVDGKKNMNFCDRNYTFKFYNKEESKKLEEKIEEKQEKDDVLSSTEASYKKALELLTSDDEKLIEEIKGEKKDPKQEMDEILKSMDELTKDAEFE